MSKDGYAAFEMKGTSFYGKPENGKLKQKTNAPMDPTPPEGPAQPADSPAKGLFSNIKAKDVLTGGLSKVFSDIRLKENIVKLGNSLCGIPVYEFNYIGQDNTCQGAMAQDLLAMGYSDAVSTHESGYYMVDYNMIDVDPVL